jgi:hypothetical protein
MEVTISAGHTKRKIRGPFRMAASAEDLRAIAEAITVRLGERNPSFTWVEVPMTAPVLASAEPEPWE